MTKEIGEASRLGVLWLLVFVGPLGWIALLLLSLRDGGERLTVQVPYSEVARQRFVAARRLRNRALYGGCAVISVLLVVWVWAGLQGGGLLLTSAALVGTVVACYQGERRIARTGVGIGLDASRRWVTLSGVHPAFVEACRAQQHERLP